MKPQYIENWIKRKGVDWFAKNHPEDYEHNKDFIKWVIRNMYSKINK